MRVAPAGLCCLALAACAAPTSHFSGTVQTEYVSVGSQVGGRVIAVDVAAGTPVKRGTVIVRLDPSLPQATYDQALAQARAADAALRALQSGTLPSQIAQARGANVATGATYTQTVTGANDRIRAARATLANARAAEQLADRDYERTASLAQSGDVSQQSLDQARAARDQAHASVRQAQAQLTQLERADLPGKPHLHWRMPMRHMAAIRRRSRAPNRNLPKHKRKHAARTPPPNMR